MSLALMIALTAFVVALALLLLFVYASSVVSQNVFEGDDDDESAATPAVPTARASGRARDGHPAGPASPVSAVLPAQPRDPVLGQDAYRAEARAQVHRWQTRKSVK